MSQVEEIKLLLMACTPEQRREIFTLLREEFPIHKLEARLNVAAEIILEAIDRASDITLRGIRGIIAEASFARDVITNLPTEWRIEPTGGDDAYDFLIRDTLGPVRIQVKLQRKERQQPKMISSSEIRKYGLTPGLYYVVETQRTRTGTNTSTGESTRPYKFGEFDILAVSMQPSTGDWSRFIFTVADTLIPRLANPNQLQVMQPVPAVANTKWTYDLLECIKWLRQSGEKEAASDSSQLRLI